MLVRSARTSHACNFQDMWKSKSATPTTSRKAGYTPIKVMNYCFIIVDEVMYRLACPTPHLDVKRSSLSPPRGTSDKLAYIRRKVRADRRKSRRAKNGGKREGERQ